jgi:hypothetical protein
MGTEAFSNFTTLAKYNVHSKASSCKCFKLINSQRLPLFIRLAIKKGVHAERPPNRYEVSAFNAWPRLITAVSGAMSLCNP